MNSQYDDPTSDYNKAQSVNEDAYVNGKKSLDHLKDQAGQKLERATEFVKKHPAASVLGAVGVGYLVGRILTRKH